MCGSASEIKMILVLVVQPHSVTQKTNDGDAYQNQLLMTETKGRAIGVEFPVVPVLPLL